MITCLGYTEQQMGHYYLSNVTDHSAWREEEIEAENVTIYVYTVHVHTCGTPGAYMHIHVL